MLHTFRFVVNKDARLSTSSAKCRTERLGIFVLSLSNAYCVSHCVIHVQNQQSPAGYRTLDSVHSSGGLVTEPVSPLPWLVVFGLIAFHQNKFIYFLEL